MCSGHDFVLRFSMVGSIEVVLTSYSFTEAMKNLGVESKVYTAGLRNGSLSLFVETLEE